MGTDTENERCWLTEKITENGGIRERESPRDRHLKEWRKNERESIRTCSGRVQNKPHMRARATTQVRTPALSVCHTSTSDSKWILCLSHTAKIRTSTHNHTRANTHKLTLPHTCNMQAYTNTHKQTHSHMIAITHKHTNAHSHKSPHKLSRTLSRARFLLRWQMIQIDRGDDAHTQTDTHARTEYTLISFTSIFSECQ